VTGSKTDTPILETPQSISVVTKDQIAAQQAQSVPEVVRYIPAVTTEFYGASSISDEIKVRGFIAPRYLDGLRLPYDTVLQFGQTRTEPYNLERAEVLKGPASSIYGQSSPGGLLNMVSKRPTTERRGEIELQYGSFDRLQGAFDLSGPLDQDRKFLYRVVGVARDTDKAIDFNHESRLFIAPSFTWAPNVDTSFTTCRASRATRATASRSNMCPPTAPCTPMRTVASPKAATLANRTMTISVSTRT
jgi:iron complex outermembrane receptor protein